MKHSVKISLGVAAFTLAAVITVVISFQAAERSEIAWTNQQLSNLKLNRGAKYLDLKDPEVREILNKGHEKGIAELTDSMKSSLWLITGYALTLGFFIVLVRKQKDRNAP